MADYIPQSDAEFDAWLNNFLAYLQAHAAALGLTSEQVSDISQPINAWDGAYAAHLAAQNAAQGARDSKDQTRAVVAAVVRAFVARIQADPNITDAQRQGLGVTVRGQAPAPPAVPTTRPVGSVNFGQMRTHILTFNDEATPGSKAKPAGVQGCEVWAKVGGPAPTSDADFEYVATDTRSPYMAEYDMADIGKTAFYHLRWVTARGERGPWSATFSALIGG